MASVWYVGGASVRIMAPEDWDVAGTNATDTVVWNAENGYSVPESALSPQQIAWLGNYPEEFLTGAPDGPRTAVLLPPDTYVTLNVLRQMLLNFQFPADIALDPSAVGLGNVDNTSDHDKPLSAATIEALLHKADYPAGGSDGQVLVKSGTTTAWANGGGGGSVSATPVQDPRVPSGTAYTFSGGGFGTISDPRVPSGTAYTIN